MQSFDHEKHILMTQILWLNECLSCATGKFGAHPRGVLVDVNACLVHVVCIFLYGPS